MGSPSSFQTFAANISKQKLTDLTGLTIKAALFTSSASFDTSVTGGISYNSTNEISGGGYSAGGIVLPSAYIAQYGSVGYSFITGNGTLSVTGSGLPAWRYCVIYVSGSLWGITNPLLGMFTGDSTPADIPAISSGNTLQINCPANGWFTLIRS